MLAIVFGAPYNVPACDGANVSYSTLKVAKETY
jgi:hypothetical protein